MAATVAIVKRYHSDPAAWRQFRLLLQVALSLAIGRVMLQILFGTPMGTEIVWDLPSYQLPKVFAGLRLGGAITLESLHFGLVQALRISSLVVVIAGISAIANPKRLLEKPIPGFAEVGLLATLTLNFLPQLATDASRLRKAARWRGDNSNRFVQLGRSVIPLTETALDRSVNLGAALALRGYGSTSPNTRVRELFLSVFAVLTLGIGLNAFNQLNVIIFISLLLVFLILARMLFQELEVKLADISGLNFAAPVLLLVLFMFNQNYSLLATEYSTWDARATGFGIASGIGFFALAIMAPKQGYHAAN